MSDELQTAATIASLRKQVDELGDRYDSLLQSIINACTGTKCLNAHELRQALDRERERAGVLEAEVRASRKPYTLGVDILWHNLVKARAETDRTHALDAAKFWKEQA